MSLQDLCAAKELKNWLVRTGGESPRAWLEAIRPMVSYAFAHGQNLPVSTKTWKDLRKQNPPRLELDEARACVRVGGREIPVEAMTSGGFRLLRYLYQNAGRPVSWEELYYRGYRELPRIPRTPEDQGYEDRKVWEAVLYTRLSDLRKAIEPDPKDPLYIETVRGQGVIFHLPW
jgi:DNA-binding response OmpR family regulator